MTNACRLMLVSLYATCAFPLSGSAASQQVMGSYYWMSGEILTHESDGRIEPLPAIADTTCTLYPRPKAGEKPVGWMQLTGNNPNVTSSFTEVSNDGGPLEWVKRTDDAAVTLALVCDWIRYTLTYDGGSGTNLVYTNELAVADCSTVKAGYAFAGAWTNAQGQSFTVSQPVDGASFGITNHDDSAVIALNSVWKANGYAVEYDLAGGQASTSQPTQVTYDTWFLVSDPTCVGHLFREWEIEGAKGAAGATRRHAEQKTTEYLNLTPEDGGKIRLTAVWDPCSFTVKFNNHGASSGATEQSVTYDSAYDAVNVPVREGNDFLGYFTTDDASGERYWSELGQPDRASWDIPSNVTFHARWKTNQFYVEYDANGGEGTIASQLVDYGDRVKLSDGKGLTRTGCELLGWSESSSATEAQYGLGTEQSFRQKTKLYAVWQMYYYIGFKSNGGTGEMSPERFYYTESRTLPKNGFAKQGYGFAGWATNETEAAALHAEYQDGELIVLPLSLVPGSTNDLWAVWRTNTYHVAFDAGKGRVDPTHPMPVQDFVYDQTQALARCTFLAPDGLYAFDRWKASDGRLFADRQVVSNLWTESGITNTLVAQWKLDVGEWSDHMHCTDLRWGIGNDTGSVVWRCNDGPTYGCTNTGMSVSQDDGTWDQTRWLQASVTTNGILTFACRRVEGTTPSKLPSVAIGLVPDESSVDFHDKKSYPSQSGVYAYVDLPANGDWVFARLELTLNKALDKTVIRLANGTVGSDGYVEIDQMVWTPEGGGEPQPGVDNPTVTGVSFEGGKLVIRSTGDARFGYRVLSTPSLSPVDWQAEGESYQVGDAEGQRFELTVDPAEPQKFYKVEVLKKK